jgi:hypothetical protein
MQDDDTLHRELLRCYDHSNHHDKPPMEGILDIHVPEHLVCPLGILRLSRNFQSQPRRNRLAILGTRRRQDELKGQEAWLGRREWQEKTSRCRGGDCSVWDCIGEKAYWGI